MCFNDRVFEPCVANDQVFEQCDSMTGCVSMTGCLSRVFQMTGSNTQSFKHTARCFNDQVLCLNEHGCTQIDAGTPENIALHSRDEQSVLVVSYSDLKTCLEKTFSEVLSSSGDTRTSKPHADRGQGSNMHVANGHPVGMFNYGSSS